MPRTVLVVLLVGLLSLSGCRLYGGYGTTETLTAQMPKSIELFGDELARAEGDLNLLKQANHPDLMPFVTDFEAIVDEHRMLIGTHEELYQDVLDNPAMKNFVVVKVGVYRKAHRALGAMVGDHDTIRGKYQDILHDMQVALMGEEAAPQKLNWDEYQQSPIYYEQIRWRLESPTVQRLLNAVPDPEGAPVVDPAN
ncbi:MAG: hypothetical protein AAF730_10200 [Bacteroidota bacterium]